MTEATSAADAAPSPFAGGDWFDPLEEAVRLQVRGFIEELLEEELEAALGRGRYARPIPSANVRLRMPLKYRDFRFSVRF